MRADRRGKRGSEMGFEFITIWLKASRPARTVDGHVALKTGSLTRLRARTRTSCMRQCVRHAGSKQLGVFLQCQFVHIKLAEKVMLLVLKIETLMPLL